MEVRYLAGKILLKLGISIKIRRYIFIFPNYFKDT